jgi:hypothetical protein
MVVTPKAAFLSMLVLVSGVGCKAKPSVQEDPAPAASVPENAVAPPKSPIPPEDVQKTINPGSLPVHAGPAGVVRGVVRVSGDPAPEDPDRLRDVREAECAGAKETYGKIFREGPDRTLADVLVAVTGYDGRFVPPVGDGPTVTVRRCAFDTRTVALTFGQMISVQNRGGQAVIPELIGEKTKALLVAMPGGSPVRLHPTSVGHYALVDNSHPFATADVFVLRFSTFDVTGRDGKFEIARVPEGEVKVSAYLPATGETVEKTVRVSASEPQEVTFEIPFELATYRPRGAGAAPPTAP